MLRPVKTSAALNARERPSAEAARLTRWLLFPPAVPPAYSICNGPMRRRAFQAVTEGNSQVEGRELRLSRGCRKATVKSGTRRLFWSMWKHRCRTIAATTQCQSV